MRLKLLAAALVILPAPLLSAQGADAPAIEELLALDRALERLAAVDDELARLVEWRFFAGLTLEEIAAMTAVAERTLKRHWQVARAFLLREIAGGDAAPAHSASETPADR